MTKCHLPPDDPLAELRRDQENWLIGFLAVLAFGMLAAAAGVAVWARIHGIIEGGILQ